jgi:hypothetical protein
VEEEGRKLHEGRPVVKAASLDARSQCPEGAESSSSLAKEARNATRVFWGTAALETVFVDANKPDECARISPEGAQRHESIGESR